MVIGHLAVLCSQSLRVVPSRHSVCISGLDLDAPDPDWDVDGDGRVRQCQADMQAVGCAAALAVFSQAANACKAASGQDCVFPECGASSPSVPSSEDPSPVVLDDACEPEQRRRKSRKGHIDSTSDEDSEQQVFADSDSEYSFCSSDSSAGRKVHTRAHCLVMASALI